MKKNHKFLYGIILLLLLMLGGCELIDSHKVMNLSIINRKYVGAGYSTDNFRFVSFQFLNDGSIDAEALANDFVTFRSLDTDNSYEIRYSEDNDLPIILFKFQMEAYGYNPYVFSTITMDGVAEVLSQKSSLGGHDMDVKIYMTFFLNDGTKAYAEYEDILKNSY